jgi:H+-transporting ATPase
VTPPGLSATEAAGRLRQYGPNAVAEERPHRWRTFLGKFWSPVPWMLEATVLLQYLVRENGHLWRSPPSRWLLIASSVDVAVVCILAVNGILIAPVNPVVVAGLLAVVLLYLTLVDFAKVSLFRYVDLH